MTQFWKAAGIGVVLLGALVAFATMPRLGGGPTANLVADDARVTADADLQGCRTFELGRASSRVDKALGNLTESLAFERAGHDGGTEFYDWLDGDLVSQGLLAAAAAAEAAGRTPGLSEQAFAAFRDVVAAATDLEESAVSGSSFFADEVEDDISALSRGLAAVGGVCG
jgi:hypothetical protein